MRNPPLTLDRNLLRSRRMEAVLREAERAGLMRRSTRREQEATLQAVRGQLAPGHDVWAFAYGSLIWNPAFAHAGGVPARLYGYRRKYCFYAPLGRGTPERPGMMLGLVPGRCCAGVAFRIPWRRAGHELRLLWKREMAGQAYIAKVLPVMTAGGRVPAVTFVMDMAYEHYVGDLEEARVIEAVAQGEGILGTSRDYLYDTVAKLAERGLRDPYLDRIAAGVSRFRGG